MQPVFQDPYAALNPRMKVLEIVTEPLVIHRREAGIKTGSADLRAKAVQLLSGVGLDESALGRYPHEFSGGQRQRINIARALALRPKLLILDEPVSALDVSVGAQIVNLLRRLQREHGLTYLFISHSMPLVRYLSTRIAVMERGRLVETGEAEALCAHPQKEYTRQLIQATPELPAGVAGRIYKEFGLFGLRLSRGCWRRRRGWSRSGCRRFRCGDWGRRRAWSRRLCAGSARATGLGRHLLSVGHRMHSGRHIGPRRRRGHIGLFHQRDIEDQVGLRWNRRMVGSVVGNIAQSVGQLPGNENAALAAHLHTVKALIKAHKYTSLSLRKRHRLHGSLLRLAVLAEDRLVVLVQDRRPGTLIRGVEDDPIGGPVACVKNLVQFARLSHGARANLDILVAQRHCEDRLLIPRKLRNTVGRFDERRYIIRIRRRSWSCLGSRGSGLRGGSRRGRLGGRWSSRLGGGLGACGRGAGRQHQNQCSVFHGVVRLRVVLVRSVSGVGYSRAILTALERRKAYFQCSDFLRVFREISR
jgi:ABC-type polar amino acid transport system ATPase subunit